SRGSSRALLDQIASHDRFVRDVYRVFPAGGDLEGALARSDELAPEALATGNLVCGADRDLASDYSLEVRLASQRRLRAGRRDVDRIAVEVVAQDVCHALAEGMIDALRVVDEDREAFRPGELEREDLDSGQAALYARGDLAVEAPLLVVEIRQLTPLKKNGRSAPISNSPKCGGYEE